MKTINKVNLAEIVRAINAVERVGEVGADSVLISGATIDSRQISPGNLFIALRGERFDGHQFLDTVERAGVSAVLVDRAYWMSQGKERSWQIPVLVADNTRAVLGTVAAHIYGDSSTKMGVIGITGTNGKTTTSFILESIFREAKVSVGVIGTLNYRWADRTIAARNTTPESIEIQRLMHDMLGDGVSEVIMEVSSHGLSTHRVDGTLFDTAVFTNLTQDHLDFHDTMEAYRDAKRQLFLNHLIRASKIKSPVYAVLNYDDEEGRAIKGILSGHPYRNTINVVTFSVDNPNADIYCTNIEQRLSGSRLEIQTPLGSITTTLPLLGIYNISNALAAASVALSRGIERHEIAIGISNMREVPGRLERVFTGDELVDANSPDVFVDYAHTPDALERSLLALRQLAPSQLTVVFGAGGNRDKDKRPLMGRIAGDIADRIIITSDNPRDEDPLTIINDIASGIASDVQNSRRVEVIQDRATAISLAISTAATGEVILIAGKGHEDYQEIGGERLPFRDDEYARQALVTHNQLRIQTWSLEKITKAVGGTLHNNTKITPFSGLDRGPYQVCTDTRRMVKGALFVALVGDRFDGHAFVDKAVTAGAFAVVVEKGRFKPEQLACAVIEVDNTLNALSTLGHKLWQEATASGLHTVAVTGSNGKTTTKEILACLWNTYGRVHFTQGNLNNHIGVPLTLCALPFHCDHLIVEMGANAPGDIEHLIQLAPAQERIITSLGLAHIEGFGSFDGVIQAKSEIFLHADHDATAIIPFDYKDKVKLDGFVGKVLTFGEDLKADVSVSVDDTNAQINLKVNSHAYRLPQVLPGTHNALNVSASFATLRAQQIDIDEQILGQSLASLELPGGRWRLVQCGDLRFIDDAYNANPSSVLASLDIFKNSPMHRDNTRVVVLGEMRELGDEADILHREVARHVAQSRCFEYFIAVGQYASVMVSEAQAHNQTSMGCFAATNVAEAADKIRQFNSADVLLKASRGSRLEDIITILKS